MINIGNIYKIQVYTGIGHFCQKIFLVPIELQKKIIKYFNQFIYWFLNTTGHLQIAYGVYGKSEKNKKNIYSLFVCM